MWVFHRGTSLNALPCALGVYYYLIWKIECRCLIGEEVMRFSIIEGISYPMFPYFETLFSIGWQSLPYITK